MDELDALIDSIPGAEEALTKERVLWEANEVKIRNKHQNLVRVR